MSQIPSFSTEPGQEESSFTVPESPIAKLASHPAMARRSFEERQKFLEGIADSFYKMPDLNRAQMEYASSALSNLNFEIGELRKDTPVETLVPFNNFTAGLAMMGHPTMPPTREAYDSMSKEEKKALFDSRFSFHKIKHSVGDIIEAATDSRTYTETAKAAGSAIAGFFASMGQYQAAADTQRMRAYAGNLLTVEEQQRLKEFEEGAKASAGETFKDLTGEAFENFSNYYSTNPDGVGFVINRAVDAGFALGTFGLGPAGLASLRTAKATVPQVARRATAYLASNEAQGVLIDYALENFSEGFLESDIYQKMTPGQRTGAHVLAMLATAVATSPLETGIRTGISPVLRAEQVAPVIQRVSASLGDIDEFVRTQEGGVSSLLDFIKNDPMSSGWLAETMGTTREEVAATVDNVIGAQNKLKAGEDLLPQEEALVEATSIVRPDPLAQSAPEVRLSEITPQDKPTTIRSTVQEAQQLKLSPEPQAQMRAAILEARATEELLTPSTVDNGLPNRWKQVQKLNQEEVEVVERLRELGVDAETLLAFRKRTNGTMEDFTSQPRSGEASPEVEKLLQRQQDIIHERAPLLPGNTSYVEAAGRGVNRLIDSPLPEARAKEIAEGLTKNEPSLGASLEEAPEWMIPRAVEVSSADDTVEVAIRESIAPEDAIVADVATQHVIKMQEASVERSLSDAEQRGARQIVEEALNARIREAEEAPVFRLVEKKDYEVGLEFNIHKLSQRFPRVAQVLEQLKYVTSATDEPTNWLSAETIFGHTKAAWDDATLRPERFAKDFETIQEMDKLWTYVKEEIENISPTPTKNWFTDWLSSSYRDLGFTRKNMENFAKFVERAFPNLQLAVQFDKGLNAQGRLLTTIKKIILNPEKMSPFTLSHELGHYHWSYVMSHQDRMEALELLSKMARDKEGFGKAVPEYQRMIEKTLPSLPTSTEAAEVNRWMWSATEMYANLFASGVARGRLQNEATTSIMSEVQQRMTRAIGESGSLFNRFPKTLQKMIGRSILGPKADAMIEWGEKARTAHLSGNFYYRSPEETVERIQELETYFSNAYDANYLPVAEMPGAELERAIETEPIYATPSEPFFSMSPNGQVGKVRNEDLNDLIEYHTLKLFQGSIESREVAELALLRKRRTLSPAALSNRVSREIDDMYRMLKEEGVDFDPYTGKEVDPEITSERRQWVEEQELGRYEAQSRQAMELATYQLAQEESLRSVEGRTSTVIERRARKELLRRTFELQDPLYNEKQFADSVVQQNDNLALMHGQVITPEARVKAWNKAFARAVEKNKGRYTAEDAIISSLRLNAAAERVQFEELLSFFNHAMAENNLTSMVYPDSFDSFMLTNLINEFGSTPIEQSFFSSTFNNPVGKVARYTMGAYFGVAQDENGDFSFDPTRYGNHLTPLMLYLMPGGRTAIRSSFKLSKLIGAKAFKYLPSEWQQTVENAWDAFSYNMLEYRGANPFLELQRRSANQVGGNAKQDFYILADRILKDANLTPADRVDIGKAFERSDEGVALLDKWNVSGDIRASYVDQIDQMYKRITQKLVDERILESSDVQLLSRAYLSKPARSNYAIVRRGNELGGVSLRRLINRGVPYKLRFNKDTFLGRLDIDGKSTELYADFGNLAYLHDAQVKEGIPLAEGTQLNAYRSVEGGYVYFAPVGSNLDATYATSMRPMMLWEEGKRGFTIERVRANSQNRLTQIEIRRPLNQTERELMGESYDIALKLANFGNELERLIAKSHAFTELDNLVGTEQGSSFIRSLRRTSAKDRKELLNKGWKIIPEAEYEKGVNKWGMLAGRMISPDTQKMLRSLDETSYWRGIKNSAPAPLYALAQGWDKATRIFKAAHTVLNIPTHLVNMTSNMFQGYFTGRNPMVDLYHGYGMMQARKLEALYRASISSNDPVQISIALGNLQKHPYYNSLKAARAARIGDSTLVNVEMKYDEMQRLIREAQSQYKDGADSLMSSMIDFLRVRGNAALDFARKAYEGEDLIYKLGGFHRDIENGSTIDEALKNVYSAYFDYSSLPPGVALARDSGVLPFVSYVYKAIPAMLKGIHENPERLAYVALGIEALHLFMVAQDYGYENVIAASDALDKMGPNYTTGRTFLARSTLYTGTEVEKDAYGNDREVSSYLNIGKYMPGMMFTETAYGGKIANGRGTFENIVSQLWNHPILSTMYTWAAGKDPAFERSIREPDGSTDYGKLLKYVANSFSPNTPLLPWTTAHDALRQGLANEGIGKSEDYTGYTGMGIARPLTAESVNALLGIRSYRLDMPGEASRAITQQQRASSAALQRARRAIRTPGLPDSAVPEIMQRYAEEIEAPQEEIQRRAEGARILEEIKRRNPSRASGSALPQP